MPAVSIIFNGISFIVMFTSIISLVVPGILVTIALSFLDKRFKRELFPTLVLPIRAIDIPLWIYDPLLAFSIRISIFSLMFLILLEKS